MKNRTQKSRRAPQTHKAIARQAIYNRQNWAVSHGQRMRRQPKDIESIADRLGLSRMVRARLKPRSLGASRSVSE